MSTTKERAGAPGAEASNGAADSTGLAPFRARLDVIDDELVRLLGERFQICREVAVHKSHNEIPMMQPGRVEIVRARYLEGAAAVDLPREFTSGFFDLMIAATCRAEDELMDEIAAGRDALAEARADRQDTDPARRDQVA
jgi:chorismate mutase